MKKIIFLSLFLFSFLQIGNAVTDIEFILDVSGSMKQISGGEAQIDTARKALLSSLTSITDPTTHVALRVYAHRVEQTNKAGSCQDTELLIPFGPVDRVNLEAKLNTLVPKGYTPIAYSLEQSKNDFSLTREANKTIILLSDGEETCGGDAVGVLKKLKEQGFEVVVHTIGFNVDAQTRSQLEAISSATGGKYFDARDAQSLTGALKDATAQAVVIQKDKQIYGAPLRGGNSYETAVAITPNQEFRLDHHQRQNEFDYFYVDLKAGQEITASVSTLERGVNLQNGQARANSQPYAGIQMHGDQRNLIRKEEIIGDTHKTKTIVYATPRDSRMYVLIGSTYDNMNADETNFKVSVGSKGDLGKEGEAGDTSQTAMPITLGRYPTNYLGGPDLRDTYSFQAKKGEAYWVGFIPDQGISEFFGIQIYNDYRQKVLEVSVPPGEGLKTQPVPMPEDGTYYLEIAPRYTMEKTGGYLLEFQKAGEPSGAVTPSVGAVRSAPTGLPVPTPATTPSTQPSEPAPKEESKSFWKRWFGK